ncbi:MAG TPA: hypothetical protein DCL31_00270 [Clostridium sp.]|nr:hypothetical protein [Clostridium sp.]
MHLFRQLNNLYKCIRSNESKDTPYIREYAYENKMIWDKKVIRDKFLYNKENSNENIYLIKDLLGLSVHEKWNWGKGRQAFDVKKEHICSDDKYKIERMQSPIFFKPLKDENNNFNVYIGIKEVPKEFFGQKFEITKCIEKNQKKEVLDKLELATPTKFNYDKFLEFVESKDYKIKKC